MVNITTSFSDGEEFLRLDQDEETGIFVLFKHGVEVDRREDAAFNYAEFMPLISSGPSIESLAQQLLAMQSAVDDLILTSLLG